MKLVAKKYRLLKPEISYLADEVVIAQAWKKSHNYIRNFNWYADTLALDISALGIESDARNWANQISKGTSLYELDLVLAAKSERWIIDKEKGWIPKTEDTKRGKNPPIRPLAHITIRDQTWATAAMMCLADAVETAQGDCSSNQEDESVEALQAKQIYSYGNRLVCSWNKDNTAWFHWGNSDVIGSFLLITKIF